jgi:hypothetical protein
MSISRVHTAAARTAAQAKQPHVLVVGGGYGGVSVISNLLNLSKGGKQLPCPVPIDELELAPKVKPTITLLAERDGICMLKRPSQLISGNPCQISTQSNPIQSKDNKAISTPSPSYHPR